MNNLFISIINENIIQGSRKRDKSLRPVAYLSWGACFEFLTARVRILSTNKQELGQLLRRFQRNHLCFGSGGRWNGGLNYNGRTGPRKISVRVLSAGFFSRSRRFPQAHGIKTPLTHVKNLPPLAPNGCFAVLLCCFVFFSVKYEMFCVIALKLN